MDNFGVRGVPNRWPEVKGSQSGLLLTTKKRENPIVGAARSGLSSPEAAAAGAMVQSRSTSWS